MATFKINGRQVTTKGPDDAPLLWAIRDEIGLKGTKFGCGIGQCRACTVHVGGKAVPSCQTLVSSVKDPITTIEGLSADGSHPVQQAWIEVDVPQCGYCQAGQMMAAAALLAQKPKPTTQDIDTAMNANLCRCGTYLRIRTAIQRAAAIASQSRGSAQSAAALR